MRRVPGLEISAGTRGARSARVPGPGSARVPGVLDQRGYRAGISAGAGCGISAGAGVPGCWACLHGCAVRGRRPKCRDHGPAGDHGGSHGRSRARSAVIKDQFMIMEHHAGDRMAAAGAGRGPRSAGEPRSRLHSSNGPPPGSPPRPAGCRRRGDAAGSPGPVARPGAGGTGSQHRRALMVAARPWVTSTMVSCCCPGSYNKASWLYSAARATAETAHRRCDPGAGRPDLGRRGREPTRAGADRAGRRPGRAGAARPRRQPARAPARRTRPRTWILTQLAPAPRPGEGGFHQAS